ncbi:MAG: AAA domain-containing protein [Halobacteriaceae archaeon]
MQIRGTVTAVGDVRTVTTDHGERDLVEVSVTPGDGPRVDVTLWGDWVETAEHAEPGMDLLVTDPEETTYRGETGYATTGDSYVVLEPDYLVDVTDLRQWVQCPRMHYLNKLGGTPLAEPVTVGTVVHEVFEDLLAGRDPADAVAERVEAAGLELGLLGADADGVAATVSQHARAIEGWLQQGALATDGDGVMADDAWRSEVTLLSPTFGLKGRCDAIRRGMPVELKTGKNTDRSPRFEDKVQAACYALLLRERGVEVDTATLLYTKNATLDDEGGDLSPAKEFSVGRGILDFVVRTRNALVGLEYAVEVPTGREADANCEYCFEQDTCMVVADKLDHDAKVHDELDRPSVADPLPAEERAYLADWYERIECERRAVHDEYAKLWEQSPDDRAADDRALVDLDPIDRERTGDGGWRLVAERPEPTASKIREGDTVLASAGDPVTGAAELARVETLTAERVAVTASEPVELRRVDVYPSEFSVDRMLTALHDAVLKSDRRRRDVLFRQADPAFRDADRSFDGPNPAQTDALNRALNAEDYALIHGPPGTGKTYTIARLVAELVDGGQQVLLSAFTNRAVDNALESVRAAGVEGAVRVGTETGVREDMLDVRLDESGDPADRAAALRDAPVVAATTASCGSRTMRDCAFDVAVVDEASQLTEPDALAALNRADRFVLVGDHHQLPPVVRAEAMDTSLFERLIDEAPEAAVLLDRQYRMPQRVQAFPSRQFYDGALRPADQRVAGQSVADLADPDALPPALRDPVSFHHVEGTPDAHTDADEADRVADIVDQFLDAGVPASEIAVVAPFRAQVGDLARSLPEGVVVDTVDRFQGSSQGVVVVSFVATGDLDGPIFEDHRRLNVALTRAQKALVLVGDAAALRSEQPYADLVDWADR